MSTKSSVLEILENNRGKSISGEYIATELGLSRNMIWRAIKDLRSEGYSIKAITNKGYQLETDNDILSVEGIKPFLSTPDLANNIRVYKTLDSTNKEAKIQAISQETLGSVIISNEQTQGRGRFGRNYYSPADTGLYMSFILKPEALNLAHPTTITAYTAWRVCEAIETLSGLSPSIKWVNDIYLNGKKVAGILTEAIADFETRNISTLIVGIGINVTTKQKMFPREIQNIAGSLYPSGNSTITRNQLAAEIINRMLETAIPKDDIILEQYKKRLFMLNQEITVFQGKNQYKAKAIDLNNRGNLIVQNEQGETQELSSGEISIK